MPWVERPAWLGLGGAQEPSAEALLPSKIKEKDVVLEA